MWKPLETVLNNTFLEVHGATAENIKMWTEQALTDIGFTTEKLMAQE